MKRSLEGEAGIPPSGRYARKSKMCFVVRLASSTVMKPELPAEVSVAATVFGHCVTAAVRKGGGNGEIARCWRGRKP